ncbi:MAG: hypothetical protein K8H89_08145 [Flavobacteriales bacterium]|jgi:hypothetical protein|nr:hypothetical protein [Flavobacteriales bacterium]
MKTGWYRFADLYTSGTRVLIHRPAIGAPTTMMRAATLLLPTVTTTTASARVPLSIKYQENLGGKKENNRPYQLLDAADQQDQWVNDVHDLFNPALGFRAP